jgi:hypothetical protein
MNEEVKFIPRQRLYQPVAAENYVTSCDLGVFVDQAAESVPPEHTDTCTFRQGIRSPGGLGVLTWRWSAAICWRRTRISVSLVRSDRVSRAIQPSMRSTAR